MSAGRSKPLRLSLIVAVAENGVIGRDGHLPWRLSADLRRFKELTMGHHLIMGRKTFDSLGRVLPGRTSIVLSRSAQRELPAGVLLATSLDAALALSADDDEAFVIGGAEIYQLAWARCDRLYITRVRTTVPGDTYLPEWHGDEWQLRENHPHFADEKNQYDYAFEVYDRRRAS